MATNVNSIEIQMLRSEYSESEHPVIVVDGTPLDEILAVSEPAANLKGLVATLLGMDLPAERDEVERRRWAARGSRGAFPVLACPDCMDFTCTVIVAEVEGEAETVRWTRLGRDVTPESAFPKGIGSEVDWFTGVGPFVFRREDYDLAMNRLADPSG